MIPEITAKLLEAKKEKGLSFADLEAILGRDEVWIAAVFTGKRAPPQRKQRKLWQPWDWEPKSSHP